MSFTSMPARVAGSEIGENRRHLDVAVVGAGFSGLAMAVRLREAGVSNFLVFERAGDVGGTWRDNTYPGCACDVMAHLYSYSFAPNPNWRSTFGKQDELIDYLRDVTHRFGVTPHLRFGHELVSAQWDDVARHWVISTTAGDWTARVLVLATGYLSDPSVPDIDGLESFPGKIFHSSHWDHSHPLEDTRVAVIGTGASAVQFIPKIQPKVTRLDVYQRTPAWVAPKPDKPNGTLQRWLLHNLPGYQKFRRNFNMYGREILAVFLSRPERMAQVQKMAEDHLEQSIPDLELRERLRPEYSAGCKRLLFSNEYYPALVQENVDVVTTGIREVRGRTIVAADGSEREVDTIILGTGFRATKRPVAERVQGRRETLAEAWSPSMAAHRGTTVHGFPNMFVLQGPNTTLGHSSQVIMSEAQVGYVVDALREMAGRGLASVEVTEDAQRRWNRRLDRMLENTVWNSGGCSSWYLDSTGRNSTIWPTFTWRFRQDLRRFDLTSYRQVSSDRAGHLVVPTH